MMNSKEKLDTVWAWNALFLEIKNKPTVATTDHMNNLDQLPSAFASTGEGPKEEPMTNEGFRDNGSSMLLLKFELENGHRIYAI